jgi:hypothetical protein
MLNRRMKKTEIANRLISASFALFLGTQLFTGVLLAQAPLPQAPPPETPPPQAAPPPQAPPSYPPQELDRLLSPIALYPDPLLAQIFTASTFPDDIPPAAQWADQHHYLTGDALAQAIMADQLPWDPSVQALLPFPSVLDMMASDMPWTQELGNAVLAQRADVMDAVQRLRKDAASYGYLRSNASIVVGMGPYITIMPVNPAFMVVPYYNPAVVFVAPRPGFAVGFAIRFGFGVPIGLAFRPWGWDMSSFNWRAHSVIINHAVWGRTWANRATYVHPYSVRTYARSTPRPPERHALEARSPQERSDAREGRAVKEEHGKASKSKPEREEHR